MNRTFGKRFVVLVAWGLLAASASVGAATCYVKHDATGVGDGSSWDDAYTELQFALSGAISGDEIWVAEGTYLPTFDLDRSSAFPMVSGVSVYGGFAGSETALDQRDWVDHPTILSGDLLRNDNANVALDELTRSDNLYNVVKFTGASGSRIDGFTITGGQADEGRHGGGIYVDNSDSSNSVVNCLISRNCADFGGGLCCINSSPSMTDCTITLNAAASGGGVYAWSGSPALSHCSILKNGAASVGGIYADGSTSVSLDSCLVAVNYSSFSGVSSAGAIFCADNSSFQMENCVIAWNFADGPNGCGIEFRGDTASNLINCTISDNRSWGAYPCGVAISSTPFPRPKIAFANCIFSGNSGYAIREFSEYLSPIIDHCLFRNNMVGDYWDFDTNIGYTGAVNINTMIPDGRWGGKLSDNPMPGCTTLLDGFGDFSEDLAGRSIMPENVPSSEVPIMANTLTDIIVVGDHGLIGAWYKIIDYKTKGNGDGDPMFFMDMPLGITGTWTAESDFDADLNQLTLHDANANFPVNSLVGRLVNADTGEGAPFLIESNTATEIVAWADTGTWDFDGKPYKIIDYHLVPGSAAIGTGTPGGTHHGMPFSAPTTDIDGNARSSPPDIGAYEQTLYQVDFIAGENGSLEGGNSGQSVEYMSDCAAVTAIPDGGYLLVNWTDDLGNVLGTGMELTVTDVTRSMTVTANFALAHIVTFVEGTNGTISGAKVQTIQDGADCTAVTAVPDAECYFTGWTGDYVGTTNPLTITSVTAAMTITANFSKNRYVSQSTGVNDLPGGTEADPWQTINYAITNSTAGDTINIMDAVHTEQVSVIQSIIIAGKGADQTILQANAARKTATGPGVIKTTTGAPISLTVRDLTVRHGNATTVPYGGGIYCGGGGSTLTIERCAIVDNDSSYVDPNVPTFGGGVYVIESTLYMKDSTVSGNKVDGWGGGVCIRHVSPVPYFSKIINCTIANNEASNTDATGTSLGGGIYFNGGASESKLAIFNSTVSENTCTVGAAGRSGGGIFKFGLTSSIFLCNTIVAGNTIENILNQWQGVDILLVNGPIVDLANNLVGIKDGTTLQAGIPPTQTSSSYIGTYAYPMDAHLVALADNGGPTQTMALQSDSVAIDHGCNDYPADPPPPTFPSTDQRGTGFERIYNSVCDIGAFEFQPPGNVVFVKGDATGAGDGSSWVDAFTELQPAIEAADSGEQVWVAAGTYLPTTWPNGGSVEREKHFSLKNGVAVYGGFAGNETMLAERNIGANQAILSGDIGTVGVNTDNCYSVFYHPSGTDLDGTAVLDGFTLSNGYANGPRNYGGGMYNDASSPSVLNCTFSGNCADFGGGGIYNSSSSPILTNCTFSGNMATDGGGMINYNAGSSPILINCTFSSNSVSGNGGGMYDLGASTSLTNCTFSGNSSAFNGGGIHVTSSSSTLTNCTFSGNSARRGGGIFNAISSSTLTNCTFSGNSASENGGGVCNSGLSPVIRNCLLWGNTPAAQIYDDSSTPVVSYCVVQGGYAGGSNIIDLDPLLGALTANGGPTKTCAIAPTSSAVAIPESAGGNWNGCPATDQRGTARPGTGLDRAIGAYDPSGTIPSYTLTYSAGAHGAIDGTSPQAVNHGGNGTTVTAVPDPTYRFVDWSDASTENPRTDTVVLSNLSVTANFALDPHMVTFVTGPNGTIDGITIQLVDYGTDCTEVTAVADSGYHFLGWSGDYLGKANPLTVTGVTADMEITANFAQNLLPVGFADWGTMGSGMNGAVYALEESGGILYAGGVFTTAGGVSANYVAQWDGTVWSDVGLGMNNEVRALAADSSGNVYAGGLFTTADGVTVNYVAKWNGSAWSALGTGLSGGVKSLICDSSGNLYAAGFFTTASGVTVNCVAMWNGSSWSALGTGLDGPAHALAFDASGDLYVGGSFTTAGGVSANNIAKWDGSTWSALGSGIADLAVYSLASDGFGTLYAGGSFSTAGGVSANCIAQWNGTAWSALGAGTNAAVTALYVDNFGYLYAGGFFTLAGGAPRNRIARWDGTWWISLGPGTNAEVYAFQPYGQGRLYLGGAFTMAGGQSAPYIATCHLAKGPYSIGGTISGDVQAGAALRLTGDDVATATSGALGAYIFAGIWNGTYVVTPSLAGYTFAPTSQSITVSGSSIANCDFTATINSYPVTFDLDGKGTRTGGGALSQSVAYGSGAIAPEVAGDAGWVFTGWDVAFDDITGPLTVTAQYEVATYPVTFDLDGKGTRTGGGELVQVVAHGGAATAPEVAGDTGWVFTGWDAAFDDITGPLTVTAQYSVVTYTITASAGMNGSIDPSGAVSVDHGASQGFTITADEGYHVADVLVDSVSVGAVTSHTFTNVVEEGHTISANFVVDAVVVTAHVFYNDSAWDGGDPAANANDDLAIATDKAALLPGNTATFVNYTSFDKGINGIMVDVADLSGAPTVADFTFKVGNSDDPETWDDAPVPTMIDIRPGAGQDGSDRITLIWADNAIEKTWLQVTVKATLATGLPAPYVCYVGNAVGECGNSAANAIVNIADQVGVRRNPGAADMANVYDHNRDKSVSNLDQMSARNNTTSALTAIKLITAP